LGAPRCWESRPWLFIGRAAGYINGPRCWDSRRSLLIGRASGYRNKAGVFGRPGRGSLLGARHVWETRRWLFNGRAAGYKKTRRGVLGVPAVALNCARG
jgi:hypothetical protein